MVGDSDTHPVLAQVLEHRDSIMAVIVAMSQDLAGSEDIFQETMLEIARGKERLDEVRDPVNWAKGVARNMVRRHWDAAKRTPTPVEQEALEYLAEIAQEEPDEDVWDRKRRGLRTCVEQLSERNRELFLTRYGRNFKGPKLAKAIGMRVGSLRTTLIRVRRFLRECIRAQIARASPRDADE
ncbi:MAG: sigma-70 family RNA polymerase sigma factor [Kiritimatiellae bacterium]|nr:sigma-70 family RNA polymerase sigma factor [Kiritimatiellia bacterium]